MKDYEKKFRGKKVLITGGLGFIGSNLARRLVELNPEKIMIVDSLVKNSGGNLENIVGIKGAVYVPKMNNCGVDISDQEAISKIFLGGVDYLFNLAGSVNHNDSKNDPLGDLNTNLRPHISLLESCRNYIQGKKSSGHNESRLKILFTSTRDAFGKIKEKDLPVTEETFISEATDPQGINNHAAEFYHKWYGNTFGFDTVSLRLTNTYGPRQKIHNPSQGFLGYFLHQALKNQTIELWGGGESTRDFNYVDDVVDAMLRTMISDKTNNQMYNLGSFIRKENGIEENIGGNIMTVGESARAIIRLAGSGNCKDIPFPEDKKMIEPGHIYLDATKIYSHIGWEPRVSFEEGIKRTIDFYRNQEEYRK